jgi:hypothetical protein
MVRDGDLVAVFNSIHRVMKAEKLLKERRLEIILIPAPRVLSSDCGLAIRYAEAIRDDVERALAEAGLLPEECHQKRGEEYVRIDRQNAGQSPAPDG